MTDNDESTLTPNEGEPPKTSGVPGETGREADVPPQTDENAVARTDDAEPGESEIIEATEPKPGPPVSELPDAGNAQPSQDGSEPKKADRPTGKAPERSHVRGHRFRIERADGSRFWHIEDSDDEATARRLASERGLGTIVAIEATNKDGLPITGKHENVPEPEGRD